MFRSLAAIVALLPGLASAQVRVVPVEGVRTFTAPAGAAPAAAAALAAPSLASPSFTLSLPSVNSPLVSPKATPRAAAPKASEAALPAPAQPAAAAEQAVAAPAAAARDTDIGGKIRAVQTSVTAAPTAPAGRPAGRAVSKRVTTFISDNIALLGMTKGRATEGLAAAAAPMAALRPTLARPVNGISEGDAARSAPKTPAPAGPVEGLGTYIYDAALEAVLPLAAAAGYKPDNLRLTYAWLKPRAWGEDWTFSFVSPREGYSKAPRKFQVTVRRTTVAETQLDAFGAKDLGETGMFAGVMASEAKSLIKLDPLAVARAAGAEAKSLELAARWSESGMGPAELVYVLRDAKERELKSVNAATGAVVVPQPYALLAQALTALVLLALTVLVYGTIFYAIANAPAAPVEIPQGWEGPWPVDADWSTLFGR
ncbi:MAG: hypothetical protein HYZ75_07120 [Elusimicrobia bacterium]|nr:hypothetical protein [Elusimicrobiota bacterium]